MKGTNQIHKEKPVSLTGREQKFAMRFIKNLFFLSYWFNLFFYIFYFWIEKQFFGNMKDEKRKNEREREKTITIQSDHENKEGLSEGSRSGNTEPRDSCCHFQNLRYWGNERMSSFYEKEIPVLSGKVGFSKAKRKKGNFMNSIFGCLWSTKMGNFSVLWISFTSTSILRVIKEKDNLQRANGKE